MSSAQTTRALRTAGAGAGVRHLWITGACGAGGASCVTAEMAGAGVGGGAMLISGGGMNGGGGAAIFGGGGTTSGGGGGFLMISSITLTSIGPFTTSTTVRASPVTSA